MQQQYPYKRKRLTYVLNLHPQDEPIERLSLPPANLERNYDPRPILISARTGQRIQPSASYTHQSPNPAPQRHPQHCLGVSKLAVDLSTVVLPSDSSLHDSGSERSPQGLLYTAGRDGLVASWELGLQTRRRKRRVGSNRSSAQAREARWEDLGGYYEAPILDQADQDSESEDEARPSSFMRRSSTQQSALSGQESYGHSSASPSFQQSIPFEEKWQAAPLDDKETPPAKFRQSVYPHTDWINDMILCNLNRTIITASSDRTICAWNPHDPSKSTQPSLLGTHNDFVKCLAHCRTGQWIASGGFDHKIKLWDIQETRNQNPLKEISGTGASIYSLATSANGDLIASGSPESIVRLWDPRLANSKAGQLVGHADNIRAILMSDDGQHILTASADATIKLWPVNMQRCLHTFTYHTDSVWSLFSSHPNLDTFYSGDRTGLVCKVDMDGCGSLADAECVVLCKDDERSHANESCEGINSIVAVDNQQVWTATSCSSVQRWQDIPTRSSRRALASRRNSAQPHGNIESRPLLSSSPTEDTYIPEPSDRRAVSFAPLSDERDRQQPSSIHTPSLKNSPRPGSLRAFDSRKHLVGSESSFSIPLSQDHLPTLNGIPLESHVSLGLDEGYTSGMPRTSSLLSFPSFRKMLSPNSVHSHGSLNQVNSRLPGDEDDHVPMPSSAALRFEDREFASDAVPLRLSADSVIQGRSGLTRCQILNDRRTVLTADTSGQVAVWDIVLCLRLGVFSPNELFANRERSNSLTSGTTSSSTSNDEALSWPSAHQPSAKELLELVKNRIEGEGITNAWATVDVRIGKLSVHLEENRCFTGEAYLDESGFDNIQADDYQRLNLGKIVLRNLFDGFIQEEVRLAQLHAQQGIPGSPKLAQNRLQRSSAPSHIQLTNNNFDTSSVFTPRSMGPSTIATALATPASTRALPPPQEDLAHPQKSDLAAIPQSPVASSSMVTPSVGNPQPDYFSLAKVSNNQGGAASPSIPPVTPGASNAFVGKLKTFSRISKPKTTPGLIPETPSAAAQPVEEQSPAAAEAEHHASRLEALLRPSAVASWYEVPHLAYPQDLIYYFTEEAPETAVWPVTHRGLAHSSGVECHALESVIPPYLLESLLHNRLPMVQPTKLTFLLLPWQGGTDAPLPEMPASHARLTANRVLRMHKAAAFVVDKLHMHITSDGSNNHSSPMSRSESHGSLTSHFSLGSSVGASTQQAQHLLQDPHRYIELLCNDVVLPAQATLAAVRQYNFKKGGDLPLHYRLKRS